MPWQDCPSWPPPDDRSLPALIHECCEVERPLNAVNKDVRLELVSDWGRASESEREKSSRRHIRTLRYSSAERTAWQGPRPRSGLARVPADPLASWTAA